jgi:hypothetical protein
MTKSVKKRSGPGIEYPSSGVALAYTPLQPVSMSDDVPWRQHARSIRGCAALAPGAIC